MTDGTRTPLKLLMLSTSYPLHEGSVSGLFVQRLALALAPLCQLQLVVPAEDRPLIAPAPELTPFHYAPRTLQILAHSPGGIPVQLKQRPWLLLLVPLFLLSYLWVAGRKARWAQILQANWAISGAIGSLVAYLLKKPLVTTLRGADVPLQPGLLSRVLLTLSVRGSAAVVAVSDDMLVRLQQRYPQYGDKLLAIHNGVDDRFLSAPVAALAALESPGELRLIFVGSLIERKNVTALLVAVARLVAEGIAVHCTLVGDGPELQSLQRQAVRLAIAKNLDFRGMQTAAEVAELLSMHALYVSASQHEGRPNSVVEAMAAGCCCVLSDIPGHRELAGAGLTASLFSVDDVDSLYQRLRQLHGNADEVLTQGRRARQYVIDSGLSWSGCAQRYEQLFRRCCAAECTP